MNKWAWMAVGAVAGMAWTIMIFRRVLNKAIDRLLTLLFIAMDDKEKK